MSNVKNGIVWSDPTSDRDQCGQMESLSTEEYIKIANDLGDKIATIVTNNYANRDIIKNLISNAIREQIGQYLREYDNVVAQDILNTLKGWTLGVVKGWTSEINFNNARHAKLTAFGDELRKEFERLKDQNKLVKVKEKILSLNLEQETDNGDGKIWLSNVLTIIDEETNVSTKENKITND